jgi:hypothetical protein
MQNRAFMADIFISYARKERARAERIKVALEPLGLSVFFDVEGLDGGDVFPDVLDREVKSAGCVLSLWSPYALSRPWLKTECLIGKDRGVLIPALLEPVTPMDVPAAFYGVQYLDLTDFDGDPSNAEWRKLVRALARTLHRPELARQAQAEDASASSGNSRRGWSLIEESLDKADYEDFLTQFPSAPEALDARRRIRQLDEWSVLDQTSLDALKNFIEERFEKSRHFPALEARVRGRVREASRRDSQTMPKQVTVGSAAGASLPLLQWRGRSTRMWAAAVIVALVAGATFLATRPRAPITPNRSGPGTESSVPPSSSAAATLTAPPATATDREHGSPEVQGSRLSSSSAAARPFISTRFRKSSIRDAERRDVALAEWSKSKNWFTCAAMAFTDDGVADGHPRPLNEERGGWAVAFDQETRRSLDGDYGIAGSGVAVEDFLRGGQPYSKEYDGKGFLAAGSRVEYGPPLGQRYSASNPDGVGQLSLAYLTVPGQGCVYKVWSKLGKHHLEFLLDHLKLVITPPPS